MTVNFLSTLPELQNTHKRRSLYSDFSNQKALNPINYEANLQFWRKVVLDVVTQGHLINKEPKGYAPWYLSTERLVSALSWSDGSASRSQAPLCLHLAIIDLMKTKDLVLASDYLHGSVSIFQATGWTEWMKSYLLELIGYSHSIDLSRDTSIVPVKLLKDVTERVLAHFANETCHNPATDLLMEFPKFLSELCPSAVQGTEFMACDWKNLKGDALKIFIQALQDRGAVISEANGEKVIKLPPPETILSNNLSRALPINEVDKGILSLRKSLAQLTTKADQLEDVVISLRKQAQIHLKASRQSQAIRCLKESKQKSESLRKTQQYIDNLNTILDKIQETDSERLAYQAYSQGSKALQSLLADLNVDDVQKTLDDVHDALLDHQELQETLGAPIASNMSDDQLDMELEAELAQMINEQKSKSSTSETDDLVAELERLNIAHGNLEPKEPITQHVKKPTMEPETA